MWLLTGHRSGKIKLFTSRLHKGMLHYYNHNHQGPIAGIALANKQTAAVAVRQLRHDISSDDFSRRFQPPYRPTRPA